jgi:hypothetical protein
MINLKKKEFKSLTEELNRIKELSGVKLVKENKVFIPKGVYHRVIKGEGDLKVKIEFVNV